MAQNFWNFSAGPAMLPPVVLQQAQAEMLDWHNSGMSVMEMSHRGPEFTQICDEAEDDLRQLLNIPDSYAVFFMQGGATAENAIVPMNLIDLNPSQKANYVCTGSWSNKSLKEAQKYGQVHKVAHNDDDISIDGQAYGSRTYIPEINTWDVAADGSYLHICTNETIDGIEFKDQHYAALNKDWSLALDMSSHFLSRPFDVSQAGLIYAGAQKNAGPAGVTVVIVRRDWLGKALGCCPSAFDFANVAEARSRFNTPPTYSIYIMGLVFKWLLANGGLAAVAKNNDEKASLLYGYLDHSDFYQNNIQAQCRSAMNVPFRLANEGLNKAFLQEAQARHLLGLKGHSSVGGMRASIYNAMPRKGVEALIEFLKWFEQKHG